MKATLKELTEAIAAGNIKGFKRLITSDASLLHSLDTNHESLLHHTCKVLNSDNDIYEIFCELIKLNVDIDLANKDNLTALGLAIISYQAYINQNVDKSDNKYQNNLRRKLAMIEKLFKHSKSIMEQIFNWHAKKLINSQTLVDILPSIIVSQDFADYLRNTSLAANRRLFCKISGKIPQIPVSYRWENFDLLSLLSLPKIEANKISLDYDLLASYDSVYQNYSKDMVLVARRYGKYYTPHIALFLTLQYGYALAINHGAIGIANNFWVVISTQIALALNLYESLWGHQQLATKYDANLHRLAINNIFVCNMLLSFVLANIYDHYSKMLNSWSADAAVRQQQANSFALETIIKFSSILVLTIPVLTLTETLLTHSKCVQVSSISNQYQKNEEMEDKKQELLTSWHKFKSNPEPEILDLESQDTLANIAKNKIN